MTANKALNERTSSWNKVTKKYLPEATTLLKLTEFYQNLNEVDKQNWQSKYIDRMNEAFEIIIFCGDNVDCKEKLSEAGYDDVLLPEWAMINLKTTGDSSGKYGYWTNTYYPDYGGSWNVYVGGFLELNFNRYVNISTPYYGVRPVIHIYESNILEKLEAPEYVNPDDVGGDLVTEE